MGNNLIAGIRKIKNTLENQIDLPIVIAKEKQKVIIKKNEVNWAAEEHMTPNRTGSLQSEFSLDVSPIPEA